MHRKKCFLNTEEDAVIDGILFFTATTKLKEILVKGNEKQC